MKVAGGMPARWSPKGLEISEDATVADVRNLLQLLKAYEASGMLALADVLTFSREKGYLEQVEIALEELEFDMAAVKKALLVAEVPRGMRHADLNAEHYYVVSQMTHEEKLRWLAVAVRNKLTGFELKKSIEAGRPLTRKQIAAMSGQGSGILNYQGVLTKWDRWKNTVGGVDSILSWPRPALVQFVEDMQPVKEVILEAERRIA